MATTTIRTGNTFASGGTSGRFKERVPFTKSASAASLMIRYRHERAYRIASGLAHGKEWPLLMTHLVEPGQTALAPGVGHGRFTTSEPATLDLTIIAVDAARQAVAALEVYVAAPSPADVARSSGRRFARRGC
jgi:hypothetical protein